ncbi:hypothetical protein [Vagococcus fluvialis]|uniref:hypothetical protein n=1 Tax=Vagococcus fluvialis TaxID=2738 RepID=UPI0037AD5687
MIIKKLIVRGNSYQRTLKFTDGLNIIRGEKTSGKSLVLSLIDYCLGKSGNINLKVQTELDEHIEFIFLEVEIGKEVVTICRGIKKELSVFWVYNTDYENIEEYIPEKLNKKSLQNFLMTKLGAIEFTKTKNKPRSNELTTETISFRDIYRYCFVNQHELGTRTFLSNNEPMKKYKNPIAFEMMFDLIDYSQNNLQTEIVTSKNKIEDYKKNKENLEGYLEQRDNSDFIILLNKIDELTSEIEKLEKKKSEILQEKNNEEVAKNTNEDYVLLRKEIYNLDKEIQKQVLKLEDLNLAISSNKILLDDYYVERADIKATEEINYKLKISEHKLTCPLCKSKVDNGFHDNEIENESRDNFKSIVKDIEAKIKMVEEILEGSKSKILEIEQELKYKKEKRRILVLALSEFSKDVSMPFLPELNSINVKINNLDKQKEIYLESKRVFNKIDELNKKEEKEQKNLDRLKQQLGDMEEKGDRKNKILDELNTRYLANMKKMKYSDKKGSYIDNNKYIPFYKDASVYEHDSGGLLECMQLSFLEAIVYNKNSLFHPKVLLLDSISKYFGTNENQGLTEDEKIDDPEVHLNIFLMLEKLSKKAQIIVVENTPPSQILDYVSYSFRSGEDGFIDESKNEFLSENSSEE